MAKVNWLYISIGAIVLYFIWKKFKSSNSNVELPTSPSSATVESPVPIKSAISQGDIVNELAFASGNYGIQKAGKVACFCKGEFLGFMSANKCWRKCRRLKKQDRSPSIY
jgi:hypothetical protein